MKLRIKPCMQKPQTLGCFAVILVALVVGVTVLSKTIIATIIGQSPEYTDTSTSKQLQLICLFVPETLVKESSSSVGPYDASFRAGLPRPHGTECHIEATVLGYEVASR